VKALMQDGSLSAGHARALIGTFDPAALAEEVVRQGLSVRETEDLARGYVEKRPQTPRAGHTHAVNTGIAAIESELAALLGLKVTLNVRPQGGRLNIDYQTPDQLQELVQKLRQV
jgi:ParB family chromosome partitioning protein